MKVCIIAGILAWIPVGTSWAKDYPVEPLSLSCSGFCDGFWSARMETTRTVTVPHILRMCDEHGRLKSLTQAAGTVNGEYANSFVFDDSDLFKSVEALAYTLAKYPDDNTLNRLANEIIPIITAAQETDGYLYSPRTAGAEGDYWEGAMGPERWSNITGLSHELYNAGHMYEAAVAHYEATGRCDRRLLDAATKNADLLLDTFGPDGLRLPSGHQEIELALIKLYRITCNEGYLNLAKFFLEERGYYHDGRDSMGTYGQDHQPVIDQNEAVGHAVRAVYMYSAMTDIAALMEDADYRYAVDQLWQDIVSYKMYITGGIGQPGGSEGFAEPYMLGNAQAYCETCSSVANALWNYRMFRLHADSKYIDVFERILYNSLLAGISLSGDRFFYTNPLESDGNDGRAFWQGCACCPPNITRFLAELSRYVYAVNGDDGEIFVNLFASGTGTVNLEGNIVSIAQETDYPWDGQINITVDPQIEAAFTVKIRLPGWAQNQPIPTDLYHFLDEVTDEVTLDVNGQTANFQLEHGYATIKRTWQQGDTIELNLPMPIRRVLAHQNVLADTSKVALQRGPVVYCAEAVDNAGEVFNVTVPDDANLSAEHHEDLLGGITVITGQVPYIYGLDTPEPESVLKDFVAIPYYAWNNRGSGKMAVWFYRSVEEMIARRPGRAFYLINEPGLTANDTTMDLGDKQWIDGVFVGDAVTVPDPGGNSKQASTCLKLDGGGFIDLGYAPKFDIEGAITVTAWIKTPDAGYWGTIIGRCNPSDLYDSVWHLMVPGTIRWQIPYVGEVYSSTNPNDNIWHHVASVYDNEAGRMDLYVDGVLEGTATASTSGLATGGIYEVTIGSLAGFHPFSGRIDEVGIWNTALGAADVNEVYQNGIAPDYAYKHKPANNEVVDVSLSNLSWENGGESTVCDVWWFGTDSANECPLKIVDEQNVQSVSVPEALGPGSIYYWRVDCYDTAGYRYQGRLMSFKVAP